MRGRPTRIQGFTLLESLVTLVIVSLIVVVLMQALGQAMSMRTRVLRLQRETLLDAVQSAWFRDSVAGMLADLPQGYGAPRGGTDFFEFATTSALGAPGIQRVRWFVMPVEHGVSLHYRDSATGDIEVIAGPLRDVRLDYMGLSGGWRPVWTPPPPLTPSTARNGPVSAGPGEQLPRLVRLRAQTTRGEIEWVAAVGAGPDFQPNIIPPEAGDAL